jgi:hypothetical protein
MSKAINNPNFIATNDLPEGSAPVTGQIVDGFDFPHTGLIKVFNLACAGSYAIDGFNGTNINATSATIATGNVFLKGVFTEITGSTVTIPTTANRHHLLVARSGGLVIIQATADNEVPPFADGDVIIALLKYTGSDPMQIQYLTFNQTSKSLSVGRVDNSEYKEGLTIQSNAGHIEIEAKESDKDIIFKVKDGNSVGAEVMRINAAEKRVGIGTAIANADLHVKTTGASNSLGLGTNQVTGVKGLLIESTQNHDQNSGPVIGFYRNGGSAPTAGGSQLGNVLFIGEDSANTATIYGQWKTWVIEAANGNESYGMAIQGLVGGANKGFINCLGAVDDASNNTDYGGELGAEVVINQNAADMDFRVESENNISMLFVDAGNDRVGVGTASPAETLDVVGTVKASVAIKSLGTIHSPQLETVPSNNGSLTLTKAAHAGRYLMYTASSGTITLPATSSSGEHYTILNLTGGNITVNPSASTNINGGSNGAGVTVGTYNGITCISTSSNNWIALGV